MKYKLCAGPTAICVERFGIKQYALIGEREDIGALADETYTLWVYPKLLKWNAICKKAMKLHRMEARGSAKEFFEKYGWTYLTKLSSGWIVSKEPWKIAKNPDFRFCNGTFVSEYRKLLNDNTTNS